MLIMYMRSHNNQLILFRQEGRGGGGERMPWCRMLKALRRNLVKWQSFSIYHFNDTMHRVIAAKSMSILNMLPAAAITK